MQLKFHIVTLGCQMNVLDSELAAAGLLKAGFEKAETQKHADIILFNTCSVRQHAEDKVYSALGRLKHWKSHKPHGVIAVIGCMAQKDKGTIFKRAPHVDLVLGPGRLEKLPERILEILESPHLGVRPPDSRLLDIGLERTINPHSAVKESFRLFDPARSEEARDAKFQAMVRIMFGCDKFCTYCIVPSVRGPEQSRPPHEIETEIKTLADQGVVEITLIGQTVNSYRYTEGEKTHRLADLLEMANEVPGIKRVRFLTGYPLGMDDRLLDAVRDLPKVSPYIHVPAQSGSDAVLKRMKRNYTVAQYKDLLERINSRIPHAAVTSDFIVGFCGETEVEYRETFELVRFGRFKNSFIFKYSERTGTKAAELFQDDVPEETKKRRNNELLEVQNAISYELNREFVGRTVEILVDGPGGRPGQMSGRTNCDRIVVFEGGPETLGRFFDLEITEAAPFTLFGSVKGEM